MQSLLEKLQNQIFSKWVVCKLIPDKKSVQYGLFSYLIYIVLIINGVLLQNSYILLIAALIAFLAIKLPLHPFDYIYNAVAKLIRANEIPGRGSELQVNSMVAVVFNLVVFTFITIGVSINYVALAIIYAVSSVFFIGIFLIKD